MVPSSRTSGTRSAKAAPTYATIRHEPAQGELRDAGRLAHTPQRVQADHHEERGHAGERAATTNRPSVPKTRCSSSDPIRRRNRT